MISLFPVCCLKKAKFMNNAFVVNDNKTQLGKVRNPISWVEYNKKATCN